MPFEVKILNPSQREFVFAVDEEKNLHLRKFFPLYYLCEQVSFTKEMGLLFSQRYPFLAKSTVKIKKLPQKGLVL